MTDNVILIAVSGGGIALLCFLAAAIPRITAIKFDVSRYSLPVRPLWWRVPQRKMNFSSRTFFIFGCISLVITIFGILSQYRVFGESSGLLIFAFGALLMVVLFVSLAIDSISGDNPKTLKSETNNDEDLV